MSDYALGSTGVEFLFQVVSPATGADADADATPTYIVYVDGSDTSIESGNCVKKDDANTLGLYKVTLSLTTLAGYAALTDYKLRCRSVVGGVARSRVVAAFRVSATNTYLLDAGAGWRVLPPGSTIDFIVQVRDGSDPSQLVTNLVGYMTLRRVSDGYYWNAATPGWKNTSFAAVIGGDTACQVALAEPVTGDDGTYSASWDQAAGDASAEKTYVATYVLTIEGAAEYVSECVRVQEGGSTVSDADVPKFASSGIILPCWDPGVASLTCRFCVQRPNGDAYNFSTGGWETLTFVQVQASSNHYVEMVDLGTGAYASAPIRLVSVEQQVVVTYWDTTAAYGPSPQAWGL